MTDNIGITAGSGTNVATDNVSSVHYPLVKPVHGASNDTPSHTSTTDPLPTQNVPKAANGTTCYRNLDVDETGTNAATSAAKMFRLFGYNANAAVRYLKIYNKASAATASDTPKLTIPLEPQKAFDYSFNGLAFSSGISQRATTALADADTGTPSTNDVILNVEYI